MNYYLIQLHTVNNVIYIIYFQFSVRRIIKKRNVIINMNNLAYFYNTLTSITVY